MFKNFYGYGLVESYHEWKKKHRTEDKSIARTFKLVFAVLAALIVCSLPMEHWIPGLTLIQKRTMAIFLFAVLMWLFEAVPAWTTSVFVVVLLLFMTSDSSLVLFRLGNPTLLGTMTSYKSLLHCFADPIIMLFIGGFVLAIAASKSGLDLTLARVMLKPFGTNPKFVTLGFILVTGVFSMFLSNTATAAMMLSLLAPILKALPADGKGKIALALSIPVAANIGGMGTPIGTPPNAIALKYMSEIGINVGFGQWMAFMVPLTLVLLLIAWFMLITFFPFKAKTIELKIDGETKKDWQSIVVYVTFAVTVLLWVLDKAAGVNSNVVAMLPVGVFALCGILTKRDLEEINWSVLWMVAGGFALGVGLQETGLAKTLIAAIPFESWPAVIMVIGSGLICYAMANFISHTATASLLVPILAAVGSSMEVAQNLAPLGGVTTLLIGVAIGSSLGMVLPISTPPNAIAASTGLFEQKDMAKTGLIMGVCGLVLGYTMLIVLGSSGLIG
ncbi:MAG: SLC13 family permease [Bacteroidales bacterium]|nr:SLC13/DASS family transporter [Candidatus Cryptobacteroides onthequi]MCQ2164557.1 SLC13 family permease [Bacteroidales bacterium]